MHAPELTPAYEKDIEISVVVPVFNEAPNLDVLTERLTGVLNSFGKTYEIVLVDDGSADGTLSKIKSIADNLPAVKGLALSRNFGHQIALTAGLEHAKGNVIITLDGDLQHPPELIPQLYHKYQEGYDIVNTLRLETADAGFMKNATSAGFYKIINTLSDIEIVPGSADYRLMSRKAADAFLTLRERDRFTRGLVSWMGFNQAFIPYEAERRNAGKSKYTVRKMVRFALDGLTSFSSRPLRMPLYLGIVFAFFGLVYTVYAVVNFSLGHTMPGWTSLLIVTLLIGGVQMISLGIIGEYLARVYNESKARPLYFIKDKTPNI